MGRLLDKHDGALESSQPKLLGLKGEMSRASVGWEQAIGELGLRATSEETADYQVLADRIIAALDPTAREG